jgi:hypothetical protein
MLCQSCSNWFCHRNNICWHVQIVTVFIMNAVQFFPEFYWSALHRYNNSAERYITCLLNYSHIWSLSSLSLSVSHIRARARTHTQDTHTHTHAHIHTYSRSSAVYSSRSRLKWDAVWTKSTLKHSISFSNSVPYLGTDCCLLSTVHRRLDKQCVLQFVAFFLYSASITLNGMMNVCLVYLASNNSIVHVRTQLAVFTITRTTLWPQLATSSSSPLIWNFVNTSPPQILAGIFKSFSAF